ncbi:ribbon-helix-helix protein, CopG family [Niameybacter massiliensis]|uniref:ribbon-helix-helix protein, CopG family n=1 Tax=Niameybacter massiliensis TaxID=1658108 RepID=UPI0012B5B8A6|nr:ribbon-helix-helix protein, CopG family [Niameybacter massiliensis]
MKKRINISLDEATAEQLKKLATQDHKNVSQWISDAVWREEKLERKGKAREE